MIHKVYSTQYSKDHEMHCRINVKNMTFHEFFGDEIYHTMPPNEANEKIGGIAYQLDFGWDYPLTDAEDALTGIWGKYGTSYRKISKKEWKQEWREYRSYHHQYIPTHSSEFDR